MISDHSIEAAVDWLRDHATEAAQATANREALERHTSVVKALIMSRYVGEPVNAQERHAYASDEYHKHLEGLKVAIFEDERMKHLRYAAEARIEAWRTMCSNNRALGKL
jgi:hypothetical protein